MQMAHYSTYHCSESQLLSSLHNLGHTPHLNNSILKTVTLLLESVAVSLGCFHTHNARPLDPHIFLPVNIRNIFRSLWEQCAAANGMH
jgi:hypothetical protein